MVRRGKNQIYKNKRIQFWYHVLRAIDKWEIRILENVTYVEMGKGLAGKENHII